LLPTPPPPPHTHHTPPDHICATAERRSGEDGGVGDSGRPVQGATRDEDEDEASLSDADEAASADGDQPKVRTCFSRLRCIEATAPSVLCRTVGRRRFDYYSSR
jgi:hypothetical protein